MIEFDYDVNAARDELKMFQERLALKIYDENKEEITRINNSIGIRCNMLMNKLKIKPDYALEDLFKYYCLKGFDVEIIEGEKYPLLSISW